MWFGNPTVSLLPCSRGSLYPARLHRPSDSHTISTVGEFICILLPVVAFYIPFNSKRCTNLAILLYRCRCGQVWLSNHHPNNILLNSRRSRRARWSRGTTTSSSTRSLRKRPVTRRSGSPTRKSSRSRKISRKTTNKCKNSVQQKKLPWILLNLSRWTLTNSKFMKKSWIYHTTI